MQTGDTGQGRREGSIAFSLHAENSSLRASDGRDVPFARAILTMRNTSGSDAADVVLHATLGQEGGTVQDVGHVLSLPETGSLPPGSTARWDVYDLLLPAHQGTASKVHMFGYRAALNWLFDLSVWAEVRDDSGSSQAKTPVSRWSLRWTVPDPSTGSVVVEIAEVKD